VTWIFPVPVSQFGPGYILGEYGHLIADEPGYSPMEQFHMLHSKSQFCVAATRALLLSTYIKWVNVFPEIKPQLLNIFDRYRHVLDAELQQRACEYYALASRPDEDEFLQNVCEEMPPFPPRVSALLGSLSKKHEDTGNKRTWIHGGKEANLERNITKRKALPVKIADNNEVPNGSSSANDIMTSLAGLSITASPIPSSATPLISQPSADQSMHLTTSPSVERWFEKLTYSADGVLYQDVQIQIGLKSRYQGHIGQVALYIGNKVDAPLSSFTATVKVEDPEALSVSFAKIPPNVIGPRSQSQQILQVECKKLFSKPPIMTVSFLTGSHQASSLRLPIVITKFFEHVKLGPSDFFERWKLIGNDREAQAIFPITLTSSGQLDLNRYRQVISGQRLNVLDDIDPNPNNLVAAGVLHMSVEGKVGCLLRLEPNREAKVRKRQFVITFSNSEYSYVD
jgi:AP-2 complex subunit alpha